MPEVDEVDDIADPEPVGHVAERAAEQQAERDRQERVPAGRAVEPDDRADDPDGHDREHDRLVAEQAEQRAVVLRVDEPHVVAEDVDPLAWREERHQPRLAELVERRRRPPRDRRRSASALGRGPRGAWPTQSSPSTEPPQRDRHGTGVERDGGRRRRRAVARRRAARRACLWRPPAGGPRRRAAAPSTHSSITVVELEAGLATQVLHRARELARVALGAQLVGQRGVEDHHQPIILRHGRARVAASPGSRPRRPPGSRPRA